jgi:hypothetical protein
VDRQVRTLKNERSDGAEAFIPESAQISGSSDDLAELLAEQFLREASGDEDEGPLSIPASDEDPEAQIAASGHDVTTKYSISQTTIEDSR